nr:hypothetical protein [uncultured Acetobacterium sp.]
MNEASKKQYDDENLPTISGVNALEVVFMTNIYHQKLLKTIDCFDIIIVFNALGIAGLEK